MVILLPAKVSILSTLGSHKMKPWQWKFLHNNSGFVKKQTDSFVQSLHCFNHLQTHHLALLPYMSRIQPEILARCSLKIRKSSDVGMPSQLTPNVWILTTAPSAATATITLICPGEKTQIIKVKRPIHIICLPTACSVTSPHFHLPPHYEGPPLEVNISLDMANLNMIDISSLNFQICPIGQLYHHMAKRFDHITPLSPKNSKEGTNSIWTLFSHTGVYVMAIGSLIPAGLGIFAIISFSVNLPD